MIGGYNIEFFNSEDIFKWNTNEVSAVIFRYIYIIFLLVQLVTGRHLKSPVASKFKSVISCS